MNIELTYHEENGILYPNLALPEQTDYPIGKYGNLHLAFLKEHRRGTYRHLLSTGTINEYLHKSTCKPVKRFRRSLTVLHTNAA